MVKRRKSAAPKKATLSAPRRRKALEPEMSREEIVTLDTQAVAQKRSEQAWLSMTSIPKEEDRWSHVEEHLLSKPHESGHALRRWKYFSK